MSQRKKVLDYIQRFGSITPVEAMWDLGIMRLAARVYDLRRMGYNVVGNTEVGRNRYGEPVHYTRYTLEG